MSSSTAQYDWARNIPCRNIQIHGFCKFEHKGCSYNHNLDCDDDIEESDIQESENNEEAPVSATSPTLNTASVKIDTNAPAFVPSQLSVNNTEKKFKIDSPAFTPSTTFNKFALISPSLQTIPTFVPSASESNNNGLSATMTLSRTEENSKVQSDGSPLNDFSSLRSSLTKTNSFNPNTAPVFTPMTSMTSPTADMGIYNSVSDEPFYQNTNLYPVNYLLYAPPPPPHIELNKKPNERTPHDLFISNSLREYLQMKNEESLKSVSSNELDLPSHVGAYHSLYPIDHNYDYSDKSFGFTSIVYKCMSNVDGKLYTMRRLQNVPISSPSVFKSVKKWKKLTCANCVKVYDVFTTRAFNDNSLILIYDYYPMSLTLLENHFMSFPRKNPDLITEDILWNYTVQLLNAITEVNNLGLSVGNLSPSKIILTNKGRIRLSSLSIETILKDVEKSNKTVDEEITEKLADNSNFECEDLLSLGKLIFFLAKSTNLIQTKSEDPKDIIPELKYSTVFKNMLMYLFEENPNIASFQALVAPMLLKLSNGLQNSCDVMESTLTSELENARLVRLFAKLDFICERPEMVKDGSWSETGERYPIKLFKDYVFHQVDETGKPIVDLTHVINCMNKLDAGVDENLLLVSPDEMTCLIMSYKELKDLIHKSFMKLIGKD